jgi:hypothetical protein
MKFRVIALSVLIATYSGLTFARHYDNGGNRDHSRYEQRHYRYDDRRRHEYRRPYSHHWRSHKEYRYNRDWNDNRRRYR